MDSHLPVDDLRRVADAHVRFRTSTEHLTDQRMRLPSRLPGWSVAQLLTHVARNADSHCRRASAAALGESVEQYSGGYAGRGAEIDAGAGRSARSVIEDVAASSIALETTWQSLPLQAWATETRDVAGATRPLSALPGRRWQELEVHLVDLDIGVSHRDWSDDFVSVWLPRLRVGGASRVISGSGYAANAAGLDDRDELAWLYGRLQRKDLPRLAPWR